MIQNKEWAIVKKLTNINDNNRIVLNEIGWTSRVYLVDNGEIVFKFLRSKKYRKELEHEMNILKLIKEHKFNVKIPLLHWIGENNTFIGFYGIKGKSMTTETIDQLSETQKRKIGAQIGLFLKKLHSIDYKGKTQSTENDVMAWFQKSFGKRKCTLKKYFREDELVVLEKLVTDLPQKSAKFGIEQVFCHNDLGYNNILLTDHLEVGVIDFGDAGNYDKSYDFIGIEDDTMLDAAISAYGDDKVLREKVAIRRQVLPLMEMLFLIDREDEENIKISANKMRVNLDNILSSDITK